MDTIKRKEAIPYVASILLTAACSFVWYLSPLLSSSQSILSSIVALGTYIILSAICSKYNNWSPLLLFLGCLMILPSPTYYMKVLPHLLFFITACHFHKSVKRQHLRKSNNLMIWIGCLWTFGFVAAQFYNQNNIPIVDDLTEWFRVFTVILAFPFVCSVVDKEKDLGFLFIFLSVFAALQWGFFVYTQYGTSGLLGAEGVQGDFSIGARTLSFTRTFLGPAISIVASGVTAYGLAAPLRKSRYFYTGLGVSLTICIALTGARGALVSYLLVLVMACFMRLFWFKNKKLQGIYPLILVGLLFFCCFNFGFINPAIDIVSFRFNQFSEGGYEYDRLIRWELSAQQVLNEPFGVGWTLTPIGNTLHSHNDLLIFSMSYGIAGGLTYLLIVWSNLRATLKKIRHSGNIEQQVNFAGFCLIGAIVSNGMGDMIITVGHMFEFTWFLIILGTSFCGSTLPPVIRCNNGYVNFNKRCKNKQTTCNA